GSPLRTVRDDMEKVERTADGPAYPTRSSLRIAISNRKEPASSSSSYTTPTNSSPTLTSAESFSLPRGERLIPALPNVRRRCASMRLISLSFKGEPPRVDAPPGASDHVVVYDLGQRVVHGPCGLGAGR